VALAWVVVAAGILFSPRHATAQTQLAAEQHSKALAAIVIGFPGGRVHSDDPRRVEVRIARQLQSTYGNSVHAEVFENRQREKAHQSILNLLAGNRDGHGIPIILFGHSWGAATVVSLARELQRDGIPVRLTVQVDSINKHGEDDSLIPANVAEAANFYQTGGILHGRSEIKAADPSRTTILGNFRFDYKQEPAECRDFPWYDRLLVRKHVAIECDPRVESQIEELIRTHLPPVPARTDAGAVPGQYMP
jgi:hypothetical protein